MKGEKFLSSLLSHSFKPQQEWFMKASMMRERIKSLKTIFQEKKHRTPDSFFFTFEDLPPLGKEYWFMYFCVPGKKEQAIFTFGRADSPFVVNKARVMEKAGPFGKPCAAVCWLYDGEKQVAIDSEASVEISREKGQNSISATSTSGKAALCGKYPRFTASLEKGGKNLFRAKITRPKKGKPYEIVELIRSPVARGIGAAMVNYYFEFEGKFGAKQVKGEAYLQKVVAAIPLAPWNWVRVQFASGAAIDFFSAKPLPAAPAEVKLGCNEFLEINGRRIPLSSLTLHSFLEGEKKRWLLTGKSFMLELETYAVQPFYMKQKTSFTYEEYLVTVKDFAAVVGGKSYTLEDLGAGSGIVEDAYGYLI